jgi:hypothetical protein
MRAFFLQEAISYQPSKILLALIHFFPRFSFQVQVRKAEAVVTEARADYRAQAES